MPLTNDQIQSSSWELIKALASDNTTAEKGAMRFQEHLKQNHVASLAARNPLLLGFLIQLSLEGESLAQERTGLYAQILDLWRVSLPQDRSWQIPHLDPLLAWRSLELVGWLLLLSKKGQTAGSHDQLVRQMSQQLAQEMGIRPLQASAIAGDCLQFWHERGVLDRFHIGHQEVFTFVHATFHEYTAGRYLASLSLPEIQKWVRNKYHDVRWREPILLAAGCGAAEVVVETLLEGDVENEQAIPALLFAAAALAESPTAPSPLTRSVVKRLSALLTSADPTLAYAVAEQGVNLVKKVPDLFAPLLRPLFQHPQQWTRLSALYLALVAKEIRIDADELEAFLPILSTKPLPGRRGGIVVTREWVLQNRMVVLVAETLARIRPDAKTKSLLQTFYDSNPWELRPVLLSLGCDEFIEERDRREEEKFKGSILDPLFREYHAAADRKVLETILRQTSSPYTSAKKRSKLRALAVLLYALHAPEAAVQDWVVLGRLDDVQAIEAVLSGYTTALRLDKEELAQDTIWALAGH